jgi:hypothetical protein
MKVKKAGLREVLMKAEGRALVGLIETQEGGALQTDFVGPPQPVVPSRAAFPLFASIFQKTRPKHGPSTLGRW